MQLVSAAVLARERGSDSGARDARGVGGVHSGGGGVRAPARESERVMVMRTDPATGRQYDPRALACERCGAVERFATEDERLDRYEASGWTFVSGDGDWESGDVESGEELLCPVCLAQAAYLEACARCGPGDHAEVRAAQDRLIEAKRDQKASERC